MTEIIAFPNMALPARWLELCCHVRNALRRTGDDTYDLSDVLDCIQRGDAQWWPLPNAAIVTEIEDTPRKRILRYWLAGGDLKELIGQTIHIERWAREHGCTSAIIVGRGGWPRVLPGDWKTCYTVAGKDL